MSKQRPDMLDPNIKDRVCYVCDGHGWRDGKKPCPRCLARWDAQK